VELTDFYINLFTGVFGGLITYYLLAYVNRLKKRSLLLDIELLEDEKKYLGLIKHSGLEMIRSSFRTMFLLFVLLGVAGVCPYLLSFVNPAGEGGFNLVLSFGFWALFTGASIKAFLRLDNLNNYERAVEQIDERVANLKGKLAEK